MALLGPSAQVVNTGISAGLSLRNQRGFATEHEAVEAGQRAKKMIESIVSQIEAESLAVVTGPDAPE